MYGEPVGCALPDRAGRGAARNGAGPARRTGRRRRSGNLAWHRRSRLRQTSCVLGFRSRPAGAACRSGNLASRRAPPRRTGSRGHPARPRPRVDFGIAESCQVEVAARTLKLLVGRYIHTNNLVHHRDAFK